MVAFPHGMVPTEVKVFEGKRSLVAGAIELDMVMAIRRMLSGDCTYGEDDICAKAELAYTHNAE